MLYRFALPLALLAATPVYAQPAPAAPPAAQARNMGERLQEVHNRLGITPAQQPQWEAVVAALRENARAMRTDPAARAVRAGNLDAPQELRAAAELAQARAAALQRMIPPVDALYAALSPEQQRAADQVLDRVMHAGHGRRG